MPASKVTHRLACSFFAAALLLYIYGVASAGFIPYGIESVALPLDFMVGIPAAFYLMVVRPRKLSLLCVVPVIWLGYGLSVLALGSSGAGALPALLSLLVPVEIGMAASELCRMARVFKEARRRSDDPTDWLYETTRYLVRKDFPARVMAVELSVWYYAIFSWRKKPGAKAGEKVYSYHNAGGYMNMILGLGLAFPVEMVAVHMLLSQWSVVAATAMTLLSLYAAVWLVGDARARIARPIALSEERLRLECGIQMHAEIPLDLIEDVTAEEPDGARSRDSEKLNCGTFYQPNVWVTMKRPVGVRTLTGVKKARFVGVSLDDACSFVDALRGKIGCDHD